MGRHKKIVIESQCSPVETTPTNTSNTSKEKKIIPEDITLPNIRRKYKELSEEEKLSIREEAGLSYKLLCETIVSGLKAMTTLVADGVIVGEVVANSERAKFVEPAIKLIGASRELSSGVNNLFIIGVEKEIEDAFSEWRRRKMRISETVSLNPPLEVDDISDG